MPYLIPAGSTGGGFTMSNITFASGTTNGVFPRPVADDSVLDLLAHSITTKATHVDIRLSCGFDADSNYVAAQIKNMDENQFRHVGCQSESILEFGVIRFNVVRIYTLADSVYTVQAATIGELIGKLAADGVTGTLNVVYQSYPNGRKCYPETERAFKIVL